MENLNTHTLQPTPLTLCLLSRAPATGAVIRQKGREREERDRREKGEAHHLPRGGAKVDMWRILLRRPRFRQSTAEVREFRIRFRCTRFPVEFRRQSGGDTVVRGGFDD
ncbi:hypothetical protein Hdeb2414_s0005g00180011 [Helianthus debilis subsp. tardiflorus]